MKFAVKYLKNMIYPLNVPESIHLTDGQMVLVRTEKGEEALKAFLVNSKIAQAWEKSSEKPEALTVIRTLSQRDLQTLDDIKKEEVTSFFKCQALIRQHKLVMNLVQCRITFDRRKITFYYTAPERVDFRLLLKDLTQVFTRVRIDLRHIGVRDETSIIDGTGLCGRPFCCSSFLRKFAQINVKLAKDQGMPIAPGIEAAKGMPPVGSSVMTPDGLGRVCFLQFLNGTVSVKMEDGKTREYHKSDIEMVDAYVNVEIDIPTTLSSYVDDTNIDIKQLEDDRNSSTGNV